MRVGTYHKRRRKGADTIKKKREFRRPAVDIKRSSNGTALMFAPSLLWLRSLFLLVANISLINLKNREKDFIISYVE